MTEAVLTVSALVLIFKEDSRNIFYFAQRTNIPLFYQVHTGQGDNEIERVRARILPLTGFARILGV
jgi:hypothetical protein